MKPLDPRLVRYAGATRWYLLACVAIGVAGAGLIVAQATLLADGIVGRFAWPALAAVVAARAVLAWLQEVTAVRAAAAVKTQLRGRLLTHVSRVGPIGRTGEIAPLATQVGPFGPTGEIATLATRGVDALDGYFARYLPQLVLAAVVPVIVLARMLPADLLATVTVAVTLPLIPVFLALVGWTTEARNRAQFDRLTRLAHHFLDTVAGLPTLKVFGRAKAQAETIRRITDSYRRAAMGTLRVAFVSSLVLELVATISVALVAVGVGLRLVDGRLDLHTALLVLILAPEAYLPLRLVGTHFHASAEGLAAAEKIFTVLATPAPRSSGVPVPAGTIRLDGVTVTFPGRAGPALDGVDLTIRPGEVLALTGPSGGGKSTLLSVLLGFVPYTGRVSMSDMDFREADLDAWRRTFAWAPQRPYLFAGTVADNVRMGSPFLSSLVDDLWDVVVGENGAGLSAGQRQRVALARALHRDAPVLLLDEPTANLDGATEATILAAIRRAAPGRTVVLVAHRPELLALADRVVRLEAGRVVTGVPA